MKPSRPLIFLAACTLTLAEAVKDREGAVRGDRAKMENDARWIYNDIARGFTEAKRSGKPLLVTLRCVPCVACMGMDAGILTDASLTPLLDQFVCVRVINANALDLSVFQVDYDLSFSTVFFNGDGTVYGRFGSWQHQRNAQDTDTSAFKHALESTLAIHKGYPANKTSLAGKKGVTLPFKSAVEIPMLAGKYGRELNWQGNVVQSCVHCHQIGDALRTWYRDQKKPVPVEWIYPWPSPETVGLTLDVAHPDRISAVAGNSIAAKAGVRAQDQIVSLAGQPLVSIADLSWILHIAPDSTSFALEVKRDGKPQSLTLDLPAGWREKTDNGKRVANWGMRGMVTGGMVLEDLTDTERKERGLSNDGMALIARFVGQYNKHAAAKNAGLRKDDVLVEVDGKDARTTEGALIGQLLKSHPAGDKISVTALRDGKRMSFTLPMQ